MLGPILAIIALVSGFLVIWQWIAGVRFPLDRRDSVPPVLPILSILKPVKGIEPDTLIALESWANQRCAGSWELLFGVESADDPAAAAIDRLLQSHPQVPARLIICPERLGFNRKVSNLIQLARQATGEILVVSDADVIAPPDLLTQLILPLRSPDIGLTHCLYRLTGARNLPARWESFVVNADFWSQVLQNRTLGPLRYALGAAMALRRSDLDAIGGFNALAEVLADDHHLGRRIARLGKRTELCPVVVDCHVDSGGWLAAWRHQLRWAVTIRVCQPFPHFLSILANGTVWPLAAAGVEPNRLTLTMAGILLILRLAQGMALESRFTRHPTPWRLAWLPWFKDLVQVPLWAAALFKRHVVWRGHRFRVLRDGRLHPAPAGSPHQPS